MHEATQQILDHVKQVDPNQSEFIQAVTSFMASIDHLVDDLPQIVYHKVLDRMVEPERVIMFRVPWIDDDGQLQINRAFRVQMNSAIGLIRWIEVSPLSKPINLKFLAFEQTFKKQPYGTIHGWR